MYFISLGMHIFVDKGSTALQIPLHFIVNHEWIIHKFYSISSNKNQPNHTLLII